MENETNKTDRLVELTRKFETLRMVAITPTISKEQFDNFDSQIQGVKKEFSDLVGAENVDKAKELVECVRYVNSTIGQLERAISIQQELKDALSKQIDEL